jgi:hypothetical protein
MRTTFRLLAFVMLSIAMAYAQLSAEQHGLDVHSLQRSHSQRPPGLYTCASVDGETGPVRCPSSACGTYYTLQTESCNEDNECDYLTAISVCCGQYPNYQVSDLCLITEMKDPGVRSRIAELAEEEGSEILVRTCSGAYIPARIAFRAHKERNNGGL